MERLKIMAIETRVTKVAVVMQEAPMEKRILMATHQVEEVE